MNINDLASANIALDLIPITPSDSTDLPKVARALYITSGGTLRITTAKGNVRNITGLGTGWFPVACLRVHATGTSCTGIFGVPA